MTKKAAKPLNIEFIQEETAPAPEQHEYTLPEIKIAPPYLVPPLLLNVRNCSACGGNHDGVVELPLPSPAASDVRHTHYYHCPTTGQTVTIEHKE